MNTPDDMPDFEDADEAAYQEFSNEFTEKTTPVAKVSVAPVPSPVVEQLVRPTVYETDPRKQAFTVAIQVLPGTGNNRTVVIGSRVEWSQPKMKVVADFDLATLPKPMLEVIMEMAKGLKGEAEAKVKEDAARIVLKAVAKPIVAPKPEKTKLSDAPKDEPMFKSTAKPAVVKQPVRVETATFDMFGAM